MTINLPDDLKQFIQAEVDRGHFASEEAALAEAVRLLRREGSQTVPPEGSGPDPLLGAFRDAADEMDEIVAEAMKHRELEAWRLPAGE